ncbi:MAG: hypothetical protein HY902_00960 [Deltaproteobacteria bacterium]|nr:hypothetical protein [Deltaproteobacteria bacterium]
MAGGWLSWRQVVHHVENDSKFCTNCHVAQEQYQLWQKSAHRDVACQKCHRQTLEQAADMLKAYASGRDPTRPGSLAAVHSPKVAMSACTACHGKPMPDHAPVHASAGHALHLRQPDVRCNSCHGASMHQNIDPLESCGHCHKEEVRIAGMSKLHCNACHDFRTKRDDLIPSQAQCIDCHAARGIYVPDFSKDHHMANFGCGTCHRPHGKGDNRIVACTTCHSPKSLKGIHVIGDHGTCGDCHKPHLWQVSLRACLECHDLNDLNALPAGVRLPPDLPPRPAAPSRRPAAAPLNCRQCHLEPVRGMP